MPTHVNDLTRVIIGAAIEVHRHLAQDCWNRVSLILQGNGDTRRSLGFKCPYH
jgi:hypothetical protein